MRWYDRTVDPAREPSPADNELADESTDRETTDESTSTKAAAVGAAMPSASRSFVYSESADSGDFRRPTDRYPHPNGT
jgi:hypothetical protein